MQLRTMSWHGITIFFLLIPYRVKPLQSLFNGVVKMSANMSLGFDATEKKCLLQPSQSGLYLIDIPKPWNKCYGFTNLLKKINKTLFPK